MEIDRPSAWKRFWAILQDTELRLWHLIVGFLATTALTFFVSGWDKQRDLIVERSAELVEASSRFENSVNALVNSGGSFQELNPSSLIGLYQNVEQQISALNKVRPILASDEQKSLADEYARNLIEVRSILQDGLLPEETRAFGVAAQKVVATRDKLLSRLS
jgi:hypothetical protein